MDLHLISPPWLNSMFGVRFATRAGRCTRGVFMQVLPVEKSLAEKLDCEYIAIVDTEGLRAPEKALSSYTEQDNELATFALCISDLTLINIGGQTMGEDMTNVLQIAAHAFLRMKEVDLSPECRIVQQFVADVTADEKNESAMQSTVMKLDEAACEAAKRAGKEHIYRQFSDIFRLQNYESQEKNVQYIPSLWGGFMAAPDYQYGARVQQLKSTILQSILKKKSVGLTLIEFQQRITDVWNAILKEDFVLSFQNTKEVSLYLEVMFFYRNQTQPIRQRLLEMELSAKNTIAHAKADLIDRSVNNCMLQINSTLSEACDKVAENLSSKFSEKKYLVVQKYASCFQADLKTFQTHLANSIKTTLIRNAEVVKSEHQMSFVAEQLKKTIRDNFAKFAQTLRSDLKKGIKMERTDEMVERHFKLKWKEMLDDVGKDHPLKTLTETYEDIKNTLIDQIGHEVLHTDFSMYCKELLKHDISTYSSAQGKTGELDIKELKLSYSEISNDKDELFAELCAEIKLLAKDHGKFSTNTVLALHFIKQQLQNYFANSNWNVLLLFLCSLFLNVTHRSQQDEELNLILQDKKTIQQICDKEHVIPRNDIENKLLDALLKSFSESNKAQLKKDIWWELKTEGKGIDIEEIEPAKGFSRVLNYFKKQKSNAELLSDFTEELQNMLIRLEEKFGGDICTEKFMERYAECAKGYADPRIIENKALRRKAIKLAYKVGEFKFKNAFSKWLHKYVFYSSYVMSYADPREFSCLERKVSFMKEKLTEVFPQMSRLNPDLCVENIGQLSALPLEFSVLKKLDPFFITMIPQMTPDKMISVISIVDETKNSILSLAKPKTDFNAGSFVTHIGELVQKTDSFPKQVQASIIIHIASWALPIYTQCQYNYEKEKNLTLLVARDENVFRTQFQILSSNCKDEVIAERCFEIIEQAVLDGIMDKLYPLLYASSLNMNNEFKTKKIFIGSVLKDLFEKRNYHGICNLLQSFQSFSQNWILEYHSKQYAKDPSFLSFKLKSCFDSLIDATKLSIENTAERFTGHSFSDWIILFVSTFEETTKLSCDQNKVDTIQTYLHVADFELLSKCCKNMLNKFSQTTDISNYLPKTYDIESVKTWIMEALPKRLHVDIFDSFKGCNAQCPFCGTICDHNLTEHPKHESISHFPSGINGWHNKFSEKLCINICNNSIESSRRYKIPRSEEEYRPYKDYQEDFPDWKIRGQAESEPTKFWKRVFVLFNSSLAEKYNRKEGDVPPNWGNITDSDAIINLCEAYNINQD